MAAVRFIEKFESALGANTYTFPRTSYEWQPAGPLRLEYTQAAGQSYGNNYQRASIPLRDVAEENVRFILDAFSTRATLEAEIDSLRSKLLLGGYGKLWMLNSDGTRRWCYAQTRALPEMTLSYHPWEKVAIACSFARFSDWFASALTQSITTVTASGQQWTVNNPGTLPTDIIVIRFRANTAAGIINPKLQNLTNGFVFESARDSVSVASEIRLTTEIPAIEWSNDDGASYVGDFANAIFNVVQGAGTFRLQPGDNLLQYTGGASQSLNVQIEFYAKYP